MSPDTTESSDPNTFPQFSYLPPEIRYEIWHYVFLDRGMRPLFSDDSIETKWNRNSPCNKEEDARHTRYLLDFETDAMTSVSVDVNYCFEAAEPARMAIPIYFVTYEARSIATYLLNKHGAGICFCEERGRHTWYLSPGLTSHIARCMIIYGPSLHRALLKLPELA
jgi:hypothetical protein